MDDTQILLSETRGHIRLLTINRPKQYNAFTGDTLKELTLAFEAAYPRYAALFISGS